ncbi:hypothetical protein L873DRAFT_1817699, partial [Choiromyces venosus 120613-1]
MEEAEMRLGFMFRKFESDAISVRHMLTEAKPEIDGLEKNEVQETKETVYDRIVELVEGEGYPTEVDEDF